MRAFACALAASAALASGADAAPRRVASLNLCTDELVLMLAAPEQIVSLTHLSRSPEESPFWQAARHYSSNDGSLLSVASLRPDLVIGMGSGGRDRGRIARRLGIATLDLPFPQSLDDVEESIRVTASALGREEHGAALLVRMTRLRAVTPTTQRDAVWLGGGGRSVSSKGLAAQWMSLAGLRQRPLAGERIGLEQLLARPPAILLRSDYRRGQFSAGQRWLAHPLAKRSHPSRDIATDGRRWTCMGPLLIAEVARLREAVAR